MSYARAVGRNTILQFGGKIVGTVIGVLIVAVMQRYLKPDGFGAYTAAMAYVSFFSVVADLGLYLILSRELSKPGADRNFVVGNLLGIRWTSAAIVLLGSAVAAWALPFYGIPVKEAIQIGALSFFAVAGTQLLVAVFQANYNTVWVVVGELAGRATLLAATWAVVMLNGGLNGLMLAVALGSLVNLGIIVLTARRLVALRPRFDWAYWRTILRDTLPVSISIVLSLIYFKADTILLNVFHKSAYDVGLYGAAYKVLEILITFPTIFVGLLLPALGKTFNTNDRDGFIRVFQRGFETLLILVTPILVGGWIMSRDILVAIGKEEYAPAAGVLRLLLIAVTMSFLNSLSAHTVTIINRQRQMVWGYLSVAVIGVATYVVLIPALSYTGAAIGTIVTEALTPLIGYILIFRVMKFRIGLRFAPKVLVAALGMWATVFYLHPLQPWVALVAGSVVYGMLIIATRAIPAGLLWSVVRRQETIDVLPPA